MQQTGTARTRRRDLILDGARAPGRHLDGTGVAGSPTTSRTPVRKAFRALAGAVSVRSAGRGVQVVDLSGAALRHIDDTRGGAPATAQERT